ncbi:MAG: Ig-like domain-containing protein [Halobacteriota archaeon]
MRRAALITESFISVALFVPSVRKTIALALCIVLCGCFVSGCVGDTSSQNGSGQGSSSLKASEISLSSASTALGEPLSVKAVVISGHALDGKVVEWFIDGTSVGRSQMKNGVTTLSLTGEYTANLGLGTHRMQVNFYGDSTYKSSTATSFLMITATGAPEGTVSNESVVNASIPL